MTIDIRKLAGKKPINVTCLQCQNVFQVPADIVLNSGNTIECSSCGFKMQTDTGSGVQDANTAIGKLQRSLSKFGK